ncbi:MAG: hypothetical protein KGH75_06365 [Rhodospirillales bacterium]|nr:hypothetical protein [Rhodospirillales bacterium]
MRFFGFVLISIALLIPKIASANDVTVGVFESDLSNQNPDNQAQINVELVALGDGLMSADAYERSIGNHRIYCPSDNLSLTASQDQEILQDWIQRNNPDPNMPIGVAMLKALRDAFPCTDQ